MRVVALSSNSYESESLLQDIHARAPYRAAIDEQREQNLAAEIADILDRKTLALRQATLGNWKPRRASLDDIACGQGFAWYPQPFVDVEVDLPRASWLVSQALLEKAKHERRRARARRAWSWLIVLAIGLGTLAVSGTQDSLNALQFIGIEEAQLLKTVPL
jgi:hypothetical protein